MVDKRTVELAKVLFSQGKNKSQIARELNVSVRTIGRYLQYDDDPEFADELAEIRKVNQTKYITDAWRIIHKALEVCEVRLEEPKTTAKDAATIEGILIDKVHMMETTGGKHIEEESQITFVLKVSDGSSGRPLPIADEVPRLGCEISSDDRGEGVGENILPLPGSDQDLS